MRIGINARFLIDGKMEGIGVFAHEICKRLVKAYPEHTFYYYFDRGYDAKFITSENIIPKIVYPSARHPILWKIWFDFSLPIQLKKDKINLFISFDGYCSLNTSVPQIVCIHDIAFVHQKSWIPKLHYYYMKHYTPKFIQKAKKIITVSSFSKHEIATYYPINEHQIDVVYNASSIENRNVEHHKTKLIEEPYFIFIGAIHPRKNIWNTVKAFENFKKQMPNNYKLVLVGRDAWANQSLISYLSSSAVRQDIIWYKNADEQTKYQLLKYAYALVYVSMYEGFGIPLVEAMQFGLPIVCSNTSAMPEIADTAALYVSPNSIEDITKTMTTLALDKNVYNDLKQKSANRFTHFDWDKSAKQFCKSIQEYL